MISRSLPCERSGYFGWWERNTPLCFTLLSFDFDFGFDFDFLLRAA
jgi:hypothetical protein